MLEYLPDNKNYEDSSPIPLMAGRKVDVVSLFSGCGGLDFGAIAAGANVIFAVDSMSAASKTLERHLPDAEVLNKKIQQVHNFPKADLLIGGYPCQSFSMGGKRKPQDDSRSELYKEYARAINAINPKFFVAENVIGLRSVDGGYYLQKQLETFASCGKHGYWINWQVLDAANYGVPQRRKRLFIVGVRKDLGLRYEFPLPTHGKGLLPFVSHGDVINGMPIWPEGEFYERPGGEDDTFPWYYMSRNRKARWDAPSFTIVANWRHVTLHPASPTMALTWSKLEDGWKQRWDFTGNYEHIDADSSRPTLERPRRLSWRECARLQTFPDNFEPEGNVQSIFTQIGNAVPPKLAQAVIQPLISGLALHKADGKI